MKIIDHPPVHLTYCLNVHPGEAWSENLAAIRRYATKVRSRVAPATPFGLGLRLGKTAAEQLAEPVQMRRFRHFLAENNMYVFTVNGFPYGEFHKGEVKTSVYRPDWRAAARLAYTKLLCTILGRLLPPGVDGSVSTVPVSYRGWIETDAQRRQAVENLAAAALHAEKISLECNRDLHLGLEPEPDCCLETTADVIAFFENELLPRGSAFLETVGLTAKEAGQLLRRRLGVCFDACHLAVQFEDLPDSLGRLRAAGIRLSKVQVSAALRCSNHGAARRRLREFCDPVYLHQVKAKNASGRIEPLGDLEPALNAGSRDRQEWRVHCHIPLFYQGDRELGTTAEFLTPDFFAAAIAAGAAHFEIETYTFNVLPDTLRSQNIVESLVGEYQWLLPRLNHEKA